MMADISSHGDLIKRVLYNNIIKPASEDLPYQQWLAGQLPLVPVEDLPDFKAYCVYMSNSLYIEAFMEYREFVDSHSKNEGTDLFAPVG